MLTLEKKLQDAQRYLNSSIKKRCKIGVILGSGLGNYADTIENKITISTSKIPHYPKSTVSAHQGAIIVGEKSGKKIFALQGRTHFYEGYTLEQVTFCIRLMSLFGVEKLIVTNAAGGINRNFNVGDLMLISDHINFMFSSPLVGKKLDSDDNYFSNMNGAYSRNLIDLADKIAISIGFSLKRGVYCGLTGPSYETPAEIRMLEQIGGDVAGMSTVPDVIVAKYCGMDVIGISCITNLASGISPVKLSHVEVTETANRIKSRFSKLVNQIIKKME